MLDFLDKFMGNFETCDSCDGDGLSKGGLDACGQCGGTGIQIQSKGVLLSELFPEARALIIKVRKTHE